MNIVYASDDNFVDVMCVSIMSFNDHNSDATIYILDCGIKEHNKQKIKELCSGKNAVLFVDALETLNNLPYDINLDRGSIASYARLFIGTMIPEEQDRILYLDSDTLIRESVKELYYTDISPYVIGGVRDSFSRMNKKVFGIKKGELFINAGVILVDLFAWRAQRVENKIYDIIKKNKVYQADQGVINKVFQGGVYELPLKYDVMTYLYDFTYDEMMLYRKPDHYFDRTEVVLATNDPAIVHFSSSFASRRPWIEGGNYLHPYYHEWNEYYMKTRGGKGISKSNFCSSKNIFFLSVIGIMHAYLRPLVYYLTKRT